MDNPPIQEPIKPPTETEKPQPKQKEKPKCQYCNRDMPNAGAKKMHEKACEKNPNKTPKKLKTVMAGDKGTETPKKSADTRAWYDRPIF